MKAFENPVNINRNSNPMKILENQQKSFDFKINENFRNPNVSRFEVKESNPDIKNK